jgi:hypothetical protein
MPSTALAYPQVVSRSFASFRVAKFSVSAGHGDFRARFDSRQLRRRYAAAMAARMFDLLGDRFVTYYDSAQGAVRERIVQRNLSELLHLFTKNGVSVVDWFGVKVFSDGMTTQLSPRSLRSLLALENEASRLDPYRRSARLVHVVGRSAHM